MQTIQPPMRQKLPDPPPLHPGDHLSRDEFERRYAATPSIAKAELIEGVVYVPSPARVDYHGMPHGMIMTWLGNYGTDTPGVQFASGATVRLDLDNEPQPDGMLRVLPARGGQSRTSADNYVEGAPELCVEVTASTASYDLYEKLRAYRRNGVREYIVWRVLDGEIDWFVLTSGRYEPQVPDGDGVLRSTLFPGLWLDAQALLRGDMAAVRRRLDEGVRTAEHAAFVHRLGGSPT